MGHFARLASVQDLLGELLGQPHLAVCLGQQQQSGIGCDGSGIEAACHRLPTNGRKHDLRRRIAHREHLRPLNGFVTSRFDEGCSFYFTRE